MKLKRTLITTATVLTLMVTAMAGTIVPAYAACPSNSTAKGQVLQGLGQTGSNCSDDQVNSTIATAVNILSIVVGVAAVIVVIISAFKYLTSGGDQNKVANAKGTLTYALIGVAVAALAQLLIHFVLYQATKA